MGRDERLAKLRGARYRLEAVLATSSGDTAKAVEGAIARVRLAMFLEAKPGFPIQVLPRAQDAPPRPHDV